MGIQSDGNPPHLLSAVAESRLLRDNRREILGNDLLCSALGVADAKVRSSAGTVFVIKAPTTCTDSCQTLSTPCNRLRLPLTAIKSSVEKAAIMGEGLLSFPQSVIEVRQHAKQKSYLPSR